MSERTIQPAAVSSRPGVDSSSRAMTAKEPMTTREALLDGSCAAAAGAAVERAAAPIHLRSDVEIEAALAGALLARPDTPDHWVFCYGITVTVHFIQFTVWPRATMPAKARRVNLVHCHRNCATKNRRVCTDPSSCRHSPAARLPKTG